MAQVSDPIDVYAEAFNPVRRWARYGEPMSPVRPVLWRSRETVASEWAVEPWRHHDVIGVTVELFGDWFAVSLSSAPGSVLGDLTTWLPAEAQGVGCIAERISAVRAAGRVR